MLTIRQNIFETNSSSTHCFVYTLAKGTSSEYVKELRSFVKDGTLKIDGIDDVSFECSLYELYTKLQIIATEITANDDEILLDLFEKVLKEQCPEIKRIVYNVILAGKNRNSCYNPKMLHTFYTFSDKGQTCEYFTKSELSLYDLIVADSEQLRLFLFGKSFVDCGEFE